ncbi:MAG: hypothetical protein ACM3UU_08765 [Ignavibacteriales bacterium]
MISEKEYFKAMKRLHNITIPDNIQKNIIVKCGIRNKPNRLIEKGIFYNIKYGFGCLLIIIVLTGFYLTDEITYEQINSNISYNSAELSSHIATIINQNLLNQK